MYILMSLGLVDVSALGVGEAILRIMAGSK